MRAAASLVRMPPERVAGRRLAAHRLDLRRDRRHHRDVRGRRVAARIGGVEPVDVGQQHQHVGLHHLGDARGQAVVVAEADLGGGDGVVLVDHRDAAERQQRVQRGAGVEVAAAVLGVVQRQQQLRRGQALWRTAPRSRPGRGGSGRPRRRPASPPAAGACCVRPSARRASAMAPEETTITSAPRRAQRRDVGGNAVEPGGARRRVVRVDHQGAADLHHQALAASASEGVMRRSLPSWRSAERPRPALASPPSPARDLGDGDWRISSSLRHVRSAR